MKKSIIWFTVCLMIFGLLAGCVSKAAAPAPTAAPLTQAPTAAPTEAAPAPAELIVFAAASMTETLTKLGDQYMAEHPETTIVFNFDSRACTIIFTYL